MGSVMFSRVRGVGGAGGEKGQRDRVTGSGRVREWGEGRGKK